MDNFRAGAMDQIGAAGRLGMRIRVCAERGSGSVVRVCAAREGEIRFGLELELGLASERVCERVGCWDGIWAS